jgi:hypothetical protein
MYYLNIEFKIPDDDVYSLMSTMLHSDLGYWAEFKDAKYTPCGDIFEFECRPHWEEGKPFDDGNPLNEWQTIDARRIMAGIKNLVVKQIQVGDQYHEYMLSHLMEESTVANYDAELADIVLQAAMFQEIVFG